MDGEIPLDVAKQIIVTSLSEFDPALGQRAAAILYNEDRLNVVEAVEARTGMMQCRPAGVTISDMQASDMYMENFAERFGPDFTEQENTRDFAVVDFEYTYTKDSVLYLGHEVGHAIADDIQREQGRTFRDFSPNELESQAYFVQSIVAHAIEPGFNNESASYDAVTPRVAGEFNRQNQRYDAHAAFEQARVLSADQRSVFVLQTLGGVPANTGSGARVTPSEPTAKL